MAAKGECLILVWVYNVPPHKGHEDFEHGRLGNPGYCLLVSGERETSMWCFTEVKKNVQYPESEKIELATELNIGTAEILEYFFLVNLGHLQHAGAG